MDKLTKLSVPGVPEPAGNTYSNCIGVGNQMFLSGMLAEDTSVGIYDQAVSCFSRIKYLIEAGGGRMEDVAKLNVYLTDMADRAEFSRARSEFFSGRMPCSTLVAVSALADPNAKVEVEAMAFIGAGV